MSHFEQALQSSRDAGDVVNVAVWLLNVGTSSARLGRSRQALEALEEARRQAEAIGYPQTALSARLYLARLHLDERREVEARAAMEGLLASIRKAELPSLEAEAHVLAARLASGPEELQHLDEAERLAKAAGSQEVLREVEGLRLQRSGQAGL